MRRPFLYMIGPSGAGKTTILRAALSGIVTTEQKIGRLHFLEYPSRAIQLGRERGTFSGTDVLVLDIHREAERFVQTTEAPAIIAEGDRLAYARFFRTIRAAGFDLTVAYLDTPEALTYQRARERGAEVDRAFARGRATKARDLAHAWTHPAWMLDGVAPMEENVARIRQHPAISIARGEYVT